METHVDTTELAARVAEQGTSPADHGTLEMIVARPDFEQRRILDEAQLDITEGLVGDNWHVRGSKSMPDGSANPIAQITLMNSRAIQAIAQDRARWPLAGDQLFVDLDLSVDNLAPGQRIAIGTAILEITDLPHTGCDKFTARFGHDAIRYVNSREGRHHRHRGIYARVIQSGSIRPGDTITKI